MGRMGRVAGAVWPCACGRPEFHPKILTRRWSPAVNRPGHGAPGADDSYHCVGVRALELATVSQSIPARLGAGARWLLRWAVLLTVLATAAGSAAAFFLWLLDRATEARLDAGWLLFFLPLAGVAIAWSYMRFGEEAEGGNNAIFDAVHHPDRHVPLRMAPLIIATTVGTHLFGGSAGREGTAVQIGGGIAGGMGRLLGLGAGERRILLMAGVAAGFGAVFGTPIAGAIFAMEVLAIGRFEWRYALPLLYASFLADQAAMAWGAHHVHYHIAMPDGFGVDGLLLGKAVVAGVAFGAAAVLFSELLHEFARVLRLVVRHPLARPVAGGVLVIALVGALGTREFLGLGVQGPQGDTTIVTSFAEGGAGPLDWWWKTVFTVVTLGSGFKGGEVTPLFYVGATLGNQLGELLRAPVDLFAGLGFVAVFAGAANTPVACTVLGVELFGAEPAPYLAVACVVAWFVSGHTGIYLSQRIHRAKPGLRRRAAVTNVSLREHRVDRHGRIAGWWRDRRRRSP
jgi:H+/Cl- antiporter ClcA